MSNTKKLADSELVVRCPHCGRCAPLTPRMMSAKKTLVCSQCGTRQRLRVYQITDALYREYRAVEEGGQGSKASHAEAGTEAEANTASGVCGRR